MGVLLLMWNCCYYLLCLGSHCLLFYFCFDAELIFHLIHLFFFLRDKSVMIDGCVIVGADGVDELLIRWLFLDVGLRERNLVSIFCLSCLIFWRADRISFFAIAIHLANEFVFNFENYAMSFSNHLECSYKIYLTHFWSVLTSWTMSWWSYLWLFLSFRMTSWIRLQYFFHSDKCNSRFSFISEWIYVVVFRLIFVRL